MKKQIMELIRSDEGTFRINHISTLRRWTKDALGAKVDMLELSFDKINGVEYTAHTYIASREYEGIISECQKATEDFMQEVTRRINSNLRAGYITEGRRA